MAEAVVSPRPDRALRPIQGGAPPEAGPVLVGSLFWRLDRGDEWVLSPESSFLFRDCWRHALFREAYMLERPATPLQTLKQALATLARRWISGESFLLDLYVPQRDGAELAISSDEVGGNLYLARLDRGPLICRKAVFFGSQKDVMLRLTSPLAETEPGGARRPWKERLQRAAYGPGFVFQRFVPRGGDRRQIVLQIDGDVYFRDLKPTETLRTDPRHSYAWDETVSYRLVEFGGILDRLLRGSVPFQVEFQGPGRVWLSNMSFSDGYLGELCTPSHWVYRIQHGIRRLVRLLNPLNWL